uniref:Uncharacterized protein n=1 Tax=Arundo donax TaxID=35708 RepID=A0A0A9CPU0_ARUDO
MVEKVFKAPKCSTIKSLVYLQEIAVIDIYAGSMGLWIRVCGRWSGIHLNSERGRRDYYWL